MAQPGEGLRGESLTSSACWPQRWHLQGPGHRMLPLLSAIHSQQEEGITCISLSGLEAEFCLVAVSTRAPLTLRAASHPWDSSP